LAFRDDDVFVSLARDARRCRPAAGVRRLCLCVRARRGVLTRVTNSESNDIFYLERSKKRKNRKLSSAKRAHTNHETSFQRNSFSNSALFATFLRLQSEGSQGEKAPVRQTRGRGREKRLSHRHTTHRTHISKENERGQKKRKGGGAVASDQGPAVQGDRGRQRHGAPAERRCVSGGPLFIVDYMPPLP
jgi:hypothetical protein